MKDHVLVLATEVFHHWIAVVTGSAVSLYILISEKWRDKPVRWKTITGIFFAGLVFSIFFAWQDEYTSAEWREGEIQRLAGLTQAQDTQIKQQQKELQDKERPIILQAQTDPGIRALVERQDVELSKLKSEIPSPRKQALQLSNDILKFLAERERNEPQEQVTTTTTREEWNNQMQQFEQQYSTWMKETAAESQQRFAVPIAEVLEAARGAGVDASRIQGECEFFNGNKFGLQMCAVNIGTLANKLPQ
ncbi:MAG TPA: hypothetical protein VJO53_08380 [Candidatus Acidoferrales bacterium]|nr:hypothetical protein [Candidatus Acidoferrales bacterium]